jgi:hypothetical protein
MSFIKFSICTLFLISSTLGFAFNDQNCLQDTFKVEVTHKGWPMGWSSKKLLIDKNHCVMTIKYSKLLLERQWNVDVCREPVHVKYGTGAVDVIKRIQPCRPVVKNDDKKGEAPVHKIDPFCHSFFELKQIVEDNGLIFAPGNKEDLASDHGKVYCSYLLLEKYLGQGAVLEQNQNLHNFPVQKPRQFGDNMPSSKGDNPAPPPPPPGFEGSDGFPGGMPGGGMMPPGMMGGHGMRGGPGGGPGRNFKPQAPSMEELKKRLKNFTPPTKANRPSSPVPPKSKPEIIDGIVVPTPGPTPRRR